ncbi:MAG: hypothetical protein IKT38_04725 [Clostridia bacterium]|nr:hypothetical protein [Clostridia bacterium]
MKKTLKKIGNKNIKNYAVTLACACNCRCSERSQYNHYNSQVVAGYN